MAHITIEHVILIPLLFVQIIVFPFVAGRLATNYQESTREAALENVASHLASTIQQLYLTTNREVISAGTVIQASTLPSTIEGYPYTATAKLYEGETNASSKILTVVLTLDTTGTTATSQTSLGSNVRWAEGSFLRSNNANASITVQKFANGTLLFALGGTA